MNAILLQEASSSGLYTEGREPWLPVGGHFPSQALDRLFHLFTSQKTHRDLVWPPILQMRTQACRGGPLRSWQLAASNSTI